MSTKTGSYKTYQSHARHTGSNPAAHIPDPRLLLLPQEILKDARVLDIGCNNGAVSGHLLLRHAVKSVVGVDVDEKLISKSRSHVNFMLSRVRPSDPSGRGEWYPVSSVRKYGSRIPPAEVCERGRFWCGDYVTAIDPAAPSAGGGCAGYDVVFALSVVKWVHLAHGDSGLRSFFEKVAVDVKPRGYFVLEPQGWESYARAVGKNPELRGVFEGIRVRPGEGMEGLVAACGFRLVRRWGVGASEGGWD
ncbi:hypothetical protein C7212DRAFT_178699 [Tuber magnatum]|uniref:RNA methyltransferase n=1 Tax=Tuber magnatum TaxID=42249 RepID=A0A317SSV9_9PEZI|nr:hypothetical protein C7212DRAFT_178699 [Tuber magnatum]